MPSFDSKRFIKNSVETETGHTIGHNIVTVELPKKQQVKVFEPDKLSDQKGINYSELSKGFDSLDRKNARFRLSELARGPLSVASEEEDRISAEIHRRLDSQLKILEEQTVKKSYEVGFAAGKKDGQNEIRNASKPLLDSFERLIRDFDNLRHDIFKANEEFLIRMVYRLTNAVILKEIKEDKEYIKRLVEHLFERIGTKENIRIFVGPSEFSTAQTIKEDLAKKLEELKNITIDVDNDIKTGGCRVETDFSEVDARLEVQIESIAKTLGVTAS